MDTPTQELATVQRLMAQHFRIWNTPDAAARRAAFAAIYSADFYVADYAGKALGHEEVNRKIEHILSAHAGFIFTAGSVAWHHGLGRATWTYGPADEPERIRGEDIFTMADGKLASLHVFIDSQ